MAHSRPISGWAATACWISAWTKAPTEKVLVSAMGVSSTPSSWTWTSPVLFPKPFTTETAAGTLSMNTSPP